MIKRCKIKMANGILAYDRYLVGKNLNDIEAKLNKEHAKLINLYENFVYDEDKVKMIKNAEHIITKK